MNKKYCGECGGTAGMQSSTYICKVCKEQLKWGNNKNEN